MKLQLSKKFFAFIIAIMMFFVLPGIANAQQSIANAQQGLDNSQLPCQSCLSWCGCGLRCIRGHCYRWYPFYTDPLHKNDVLSLSDSNSADFSLELTEAHDVSLKIYDVTGRLIKTLAESTLPEGENQIEWNKTDEYGNTVSAGIYILQLNAGTEYSDLRKLTVMN
ncbi:MAG: T9SS type A sorting domain-containing protein [Saprospiraceae bacterium]|uniref:T9SS type A sorting domain-containing protein n=1 Tax=Candidatus Opimibacter skivensis TaxID=2982028 RepID=A0A9D7XTV1_9BACT|nr:T9SS type A sorting domain-containing protein [Candidatus Opimibacter skivensis]